MPPQYTVEDDDEKTTPKFSVADDDEGEGSSTAASTAPTDEEIEAAYGKDVSPKIRAAVKSGVAPMQKPTQFEQENARPYIENLGMREPGTGLQPQEYLGLPNTRLLKEAGKGAVGLVKGTGGLVNDLVTGEANPETGELEHGAGGLVGLNAQGEFDPTSKWQAVVKKNITEPAAAEWEKGTQEGGLPGIGHKVAAAVPLVGPWAASLGERAGTGDVGGAGSEALGTIAAGEALPHAPEAVRDVTNKITKGTPLTDAGKLEAAKQQALVVKKPSMTETEYAAKVSDSMPELQKIAQDNAGKINTPRKAASALTNQISLMEAPISTHLETLTGPEDMVNPQDYHAGLAQSIDQALAKNPGQLTPKEIEAAKKQVLEFIGDQPKTLAEIEGNRRRLNTDAESYFSARPADKRVMDASDATAIAQRAAGDYLRDKLYGDQRTTGLLERAGVTAQDQAGNPVSMRDFRKRVGNLIDIRNHFEDAIVRAEQTGDWSPFEKLRSGPSLAAGGIGAVGGLAAGGPIGALFGTLLGEGAKAWGDYLRSKNPNLNVQKMFRNLEGVKTAPNNLEVRVQPQVRPPGTINGPELPAEVRGPAFEVPGNAARPNESALWQQQVGTLPDIDQWGPTGRPIGPQEAPQTAIPPIQGEQLPLGLPEGQHELFNLPQTPRVGEPATAPERAGVKAFLPEPRATELPLPGTAELQHPELFPKQSGTGIPERNVQRMANGRMARIYEGTSEPRIVGHTAEGGPIREGETVEPREVGGPGRKGTLAPIQTSGIEDLKVGDTFVDEKGDPRRITDITDDGTIKTADHTLRDYDGKIKHLGEINSPQAQIARGGKFHPEGEEIERHDLGEIGGEEENGALGKIEGPEKVFRAHDEGSTAVNPRSHAHATADVEEARKYLAGREAVEGKPQQLSAIDLTKLKPEEYERFTGPNGADWIRFTRDLKPEEMEPVELPRETAEKKTLKTRR